MVAQGKVWTWWRAYSTTEGGKEEVEIRNPNYYWDLHALCMQAWGLCITMGNSSTQQLKPPVKSAAAAVAAGFQFTSPVQLQVHAGLARGWHTRAHPHQPTCMHSMYGSGDGGGITLQTLRATSCFKV
jgi:hypothetical protein